MIQAGEAFKVTERQPKVGHVRQSTACHLPVFPEERDFVMYFAVPRKRISRRESKPVAGIDVAAVALFRAAGQFQSAEYGQAYIRLEHRLARMGSAFGREYLPDSR